MKPTTAVAERVWSGAWDAPAAGGDVEPGQALFVGIGQSAVCWYRCALPATFLGHDWVGLAGIPPKCGYLTGLVRGQTIIPPWRSYKVIVLQQPRGPRWLAVIRELQSYGIRVIYEVDDYLHAIRKMPDHDWHKDFDRKALRDYELCMGACDAMIVSTPALAARYRRFNRRVYVCVNGIDMGRYDLTRPRRESINVLWAGGTGHGRAVHDWLVPLAELMDRREDVNFVSVGQPFAEPFRARFGPDRALSLPFTMVDHYPAAMTLGDVALAPAGSNAFYRCKSDLRWVEAGAIGIPIIADPDVYPEIDDGVTGFHAGTGAEAAGLLERLLDDRQRRDDVGQMARVHVRATRDVRITAQCWARAFSDVYAPTT